MNRFLLLCASCLTLGPLCDVQAGPLVFLGKGVAAWRKQLEKPQASDRRSAAFALGRLGDQAVSAVPDLVRCLSDNDAGVREMAATAIGDIAVALKGGNDKMWDDSGGWLNKLLKDDRSPRVRRAAAYALGAFGPRAAGAVDTLKDALSNKEPSVRQNAAWALGQIGAQAGEAVDALRQCLKDDNPLVRRDAAGALGSMGEAGTAAGNDLVRLLKDERDSIVKKAALDSLSRIAGPKQADLADNLKPLLEEKDPDIRLNTAIVLGRIGGDAALPAVPVLRAGLRDADVQVREMVASALALPNSKAAAKAAMDALAETLNSDSNAVPVRIMAAVAISHIGPDAEKIVPKVAKALTPNHPKEVRLFAAEALAQIKYPANKEAASAMLDAIKNDSDPNVRQKCVWAFFGASREQLSDSGAEAVLKKVLSETGNEMALVRFDAARKLAQALGADAPDKTCDVLLEMYDFKGLNVYTGTDSNVDRGRSEGGAGKATVKEKLGGSARYMAVQAMGFLGDKARKNDKILATMRQAVKDKMDDLLRKTALKALKEIGLDE